MGGGGDALVCTTIRLNEFMPDLITKCNSGTIVISSEQLLLE